MSKRVNVRPGTGGNGLKILRNFAIAGVMALVAVMQAAPRANAAPTYVSIAVDGNTGDVLQATRPDTRVHPASLTKIMTLYIVFEELEAGRISLDTPFKVSKFAAGQVPSKLGLKPDRPSRCATQSLPWSRNRPTTSP